MMRRSKNPVNFFINIYFVSTSILYGFAKINVIVISDFFINRIRIYTW